MIAAPLIATLLAQSPALEQPSPPPNVAVEEPVYIPRFLAPLLGGGSLAMLGGAAGFKVAEHDVLAPARMPVTGVTQAEAVAAAQRAQTYSHLALAMFLSAAVMASATIVVAVLTRWAD